MATANLGRVGFVNKGTYSGATAYKVNDVVVYNTGTYACIQANTGQAPTNTNYWVNWVADNAVHKTGDETKAGVLTLTDGLKLQGKNVSPFSGFKNYIINGNKVVNQRALTSNDNSYNQDRWYKSGINWYHGIEGDNNLINGKTYTLSWVGVATASYYVGTATSATINAQSFTAIANGGNFTLTISVGKNLWIKFASDATGSTFNFVQLEEGSVATPFEQRPYWLELSLCQRYYEVCQLDMVFYGLSGMLWKQSMLYRVIKRSTPTLAINVVGSFNLGGHSVNSNFSTVTLAATVQSSSSCSTNTVLIASSEL